MIAETEKYVSCERRAYSAEQQLAAMQSNNVRLQVHVDKLRMKYEPGTAVLTFLFSGSFGYHDYYYYDYDRRR